MKHIVLMLLIITAIATGLSFVPRSVAAASFAPYRYVAAAGSCTLPDGTSGSQSNDYNNTCCPSGVTDASQSDWATRCFFGKYISPAIALLSAGIGTLVVISIIYGAFETITAGGDESKAAAGRTRIIQSLIGLFAFLSLFALMQFLVPGGVI